jgi:hypothetical protein
LAGKNLACQVNNIKLSIVVEFVDNHLREQAANGEKVLKSEAVKALNEHNPAWAYITCTRIDEWRIQLLEKGKCNQERGQKKVDELFHNLLMNKLWMKIVVEITS